MHVRVMVMLSVLVGLLLMVGSPALARGQRIIDDNDRVSLPGNVHPLARSQFDMGASDLALNMERMVLPLRPSPGQQAALDQYTAQLQDPASPNYHRWLTPEEFGTRFGASTEDLAAVTGWLTSHGFRVNEVGAGRNWINFSGTASNVARSLGAQIHDYYVDGKVYHANRQNPSIPRGLSDLVVGVLSLHNFPRKAMNSGLRIAAPLALQPDYTGGSTHYLAPGDFATIYNVNPLYSAGIDGTGQSIAIVGRTHPSSSNWATFRSKMGLPANAPQVIVNGTDPGDLGSGEDGEADLDVEWSGAVAKNATIKFVVSKSTNTTDGVDLSAQYIVNNNLAPVMSVSFGQCESLMGTAENAFYNNLWAQAAAQGITVFVAAGDSGAAACSAGSASVGSGTGVSGLCSTPYNVSVGGTQFADGTGSYWSSSNRTGYASAQGYIPESAWNESGNVSGGSGLWATGGGLSSVYTKPSWQAGPGVPADNHRAVPDVALTAASHDGYLVQTQGALYVIGGTSAGSPSFAGLMALVVQQTGQRQGNANVRLYQLASAQYGAGGPAVYHDATTGNNSVPGVTGNSCSAGYDMATGLGSVDANALVTNWAAAALPSFSLATSPASVSVPQGSVAVATISSTVAGSYSSSISFSASGLPAGATAAFSATSLPAPGSGSVALTLAAGTLTPAGSYTVTVSGSDGTTTHSVPIAFTVTGAAAPSLSLSASPAAFSLVAGGSGSATVTASVSGGFNSVLPLSVSGLPSGATATLSPASLPTPGSGGVTLTVATSASTPAGTFTITVSGTGAGITASVHLTMTVVASGTTATLFNDGFESSGWSTAQVSGSGGRWSLASAGRYPSATPHSGTKLADFNSYTAVSGSQTRIYRSAGFAVPGSSGTVTLKFWMYHDTGYAGYHDTLQPQLSVNGAAWVNLGSSVSRYNGSTGWSQTSIDLSAYKGQTVQLGFLGSSAYGNDIYLDDVLVTAQ